MSNRRLTKGAEIPADGVDVDHVRPLSLGGEDIDSNVQVLCHGCHSRPVPRPLHPLLDLSCHSIRSSRVGHRARSQ
nr:HNH endonuclease [Streptomyces sp. S1D4-11]